MPKARSTFRQREFSEVELKNFNATRWKGTDWISVQKWALNNIWCFNRCSKLTQKLLQVVELVTKRILNCQFLVWYSGWPQPFVNAKKKTITESFSRYLSNDIRTVFMKVFLYSCMRIVRSYKILVYKFFIMDFLKSNINFGMNIYWRLWLVK